MVATVVTNSLVVNNSFPTAVSCVNNLSAVISPIILSASWRSTAEIASQDDARSDWYIVKSGVGYAVLKQPSLTTEAVGAVGDTLKRKSIRRRTEALGAITDPIKKKAAHSGIFDGLGFVLESYRRRIIPKLQTETLGLVVETTKKKALHGKTEALGAITETLRKKRTVLAFAELALSVTEAFKKKALHQRTEALGAIGEAIGRAAPKYRLLTTEALGSITEAVKKKAIHKLSELLVSPIETLVKRAFRTLTTEALGVITDVVHKRVSRIPMLEPIGLVTDATKKKALKVLAQLVTLSDTIRRGQFTKVSLGDTILASDSIQKRPRFVRVLVQVIRSTISGTS